MKNHHKIIITLCRNKLEKESPILSFQKKMNLSKNHLYERDMHTKILAIIACLLWGSAFAAAKIGFTYTTPLHLSGLRFMLAGILLIPFLIYQRTDWKANLKEWKYMLLFGILQTFIQYGLFFMGLDTVPASAAAIIIGGGPLFVAIMAHFLMNNDKLTPRKSFAIVLGLTGVAFISISKGITTDTGYHFWIGIGFLIISNITGAFTNIIVAKNKNRVSPIMLTAFANFTGGALLYIVSCFTENYALREYTTEFYIALIWLAFIPAAAFSIWFTLLKRPKVQVSELNIWKFVVPVTGCLLSWMILPEEAPDIYSVTGIAIISMALITLQLKTKAR